MARRPADPHTLAGPYALNALPPRDRDRFERHLAACEACSEEVRGLRETAARLAAAAAVPPAAGLRDQVMAEVARTRQLPPAVPVTRRWPRTTGWSAALGRRGLAGRRSRVRPLAVAVTALLLAAAVVFAGLTLVTQQRLNQAQARDHALAALLTAPDAKMMSARASGGGTATIVMSQHEHALAFSAAGLPTPPEGKAYELWLMGPPRDRSAAMLPRPAHGMTAPVIATGLRAGDMVELTVEPASGSARPTSPPVLRVVL